MTRATKKKFPQNTIVVILSLVIVTIFFIILFKYRQNNDVLIPVKMLLVRDLQYNQQTFPQYLNIGELKSGDVEVSNTGKKIFEITNLTRTQEGPNQIVILEGNVLAQKNRILSGYRYKNQDIYIGSTVQFFPSNTLIYGQIIDINNSRKIAQKTLHLKGKLYSQYLWFAQYLSSLSMTEQTKENNLEAIKIRKVTYASSELDSLYAMNNSIFGRGSLSAVDIEIDFDLPVTVSDGEYYYSLIQSVKVNNQLFIPTKQYNLYGVRITQILE